MFISPKKILVYYYSFQMYFKPQILQPKLVLNFIQLFDSY